MITSGSSSHASASQEVDLTPITALPVQTHAPVMRRGNATCATVTIIQGESTFEQHFTAPQPGALTLDMACKWGKGGFTSADVTCTGGLAGTALGGTETQLSTSTATFKPSELVASEFIDTVTVISASGKFQNSPHYVCQY